MLSTLINFSKYTKIKNNTVRSMYFNSGGQGQKTSIYGARRGKCPFLAVSSYFSGGSAAYELRDIWARSKISVEFIETLDLEYVVLYCIR